MALDPILWAMKDAPVANTDEWAVLACLAEHAEEDGCNAFPAQRTIGDRTRLAERTVQRRLAALEDRGLICRGNQEAAAYLPADRRPVVWDLMIPYAWFGNPDRVNAFRHTKGRDALEPDDRPELPPPPEKPRRADAGISRSGKTNGGRTTSHPDTANGVSDSHPDTGGLQVRGDYESATGRLSVPSRGDYESPNPPLINPPHNPPLPSPTPPQRTRPKSDKPDREGKGRKSTQERQRQPDSGDVATAVSLVPATYRPALTAEAARWWPAADAALASGYTLEDLAIVVGRSWPSNVESPGGLVAKRLYEAARTSYVPAEAPAALEWCGQCEHPTSRFVENSDGKVDHCPRCNPTVVRAAATATTSAGSTS